MNTTHAVSDNTQAAKDVITLLAALSPMLIQNLQAQVGQLRQDQVAQQNAVNSGAAQSEARENQLLEQPKDNGDKVEEYEEEALADGNIRRSYQNGAVRLENPKSGVIQEERPDGSFIVSMPDGHVLFQQFAGEPLLAYDLNAPEKAPALTTVARAKVEAGADSFVYAFQDGDSTHLVDVQSLRLFRLQARSGLSAAA